MFLHFSSSEAYHKNLSVSVASPTASPCWNKETLQDFSKGNSILRVCAKGFLAPRGFHPVVFLPLRLFPLDTCLDVALSGALISFAMCTPPPPVFPSPGLDHTIFPPHAYFSGLPTSGLCPSQFLTCDFTLGLSKSMALPSLGLYTPGLLPSWVRPLRVVDSVSSRFTI